ncbi:MAG: translation initiation factor IF-6 [Candidatus Heimdallarchaeota archaeon]|nr:translation initiation factor IF-6 [Candidatus Heimdallarchaeota archaeon]
MLGKGDILGNPYLGVFCSANENLAVVPITSPPEFLEIVKNNLQVENVIKLSVDSSSTIGALMRFNSKGAVASQFISNAEISKLPDNISVTKIDQKFNAMGNNVLANDNGALVHPSFSPETVKEISEALDVPVEKGTIAGYKTVGSSAVATNKGVIVHPHTSTYEMEVFEKILGIKPQICTANYGTGQVGACMVANSKGAVIGETSTPIELGRIEEGLVLY